MKNEKKYHYCHLTRESLNVLPLVSNIYQWPKRWFQIEQSEIIISILLFILLYTLYLVHLSSTIICVLKTTYLLKYNEAKVSILLQQTPMFSLAFLLISIFSVVSVLFISRCFPTKYMYNYIIKVELINFNFILTKRYEHRKFSISRDILPLFRKTI